VKPGHLLSSSATPVARIWDSESCKTLYACWNEHGFVTRQDRLAERNNTARIIGHGHSIGAFLAVWLIWKWLADLAVLVTIQTTILSLLVPVCV
jgi:hypothetical protein